MGGGGLTEVKHGVGVVDAGMVGSEFWGSGAIGFMSDGLGFGVRDGGGLMMQGQCSK